VAAAKGECDRMIKVEMIGRVGRRIQKSGKMIMGLKYLRHSCLRFRGYDENLQPVTRTVRRLVMVIVMTLPGLVRGAAASGLVNVTVDETTVIQKEFKGIGFEVSVAVAEITPNEVDEVFAKRWQQINPSHALIGYADSWDWDRVVPFMKRVLAGSDIWLTPGDPSASKRLREAGIKNVNAPPPGAKEIDVGAGDAEGGLKAVEAAMKAMNSGASAVTYVSFCDSPNGEHRGMFEWKRPGFPTRPTYYAAGMLAQYVKGPATVFKVTSDLPDLQMAYLKSRDGLVTLIAVNRSKKRIGFKLHDSQRKGTEMRQYNYCVTNPPTFRFGDMQQWGSVLGKGGHGRGSTFSVPGETLAVLRTVGDREPPEQIRFVDVSEAEGGGNLLKWDAVVDKDLCYYRVYRMNMKNIRFAKKTHIGSTQATQFADRDPPKGKKAYYGVVGVDVHGNCEK